MQKQSILNALQRAIDALPHSNFNDIANTNVEKLTRHDDINRQTTRPATPLWRRSKKTYPLLIAAAMLFIGFQWFSQYAMTVATVTLETNPSFILKVNRQMDILAVTPLNDDAEQILNDLTLKGLSFEEAMLQLLNRSNLSDAGTDEQKAFLLSTRARNERTLQRLKAIETDVAKAFASNHEETVVALQSFSENDMDPSDDATKAGRAILIRKIIQSDPTRSSHELQDLPLIELLRISRMTDAAVDIYGNLTPTDDDRDDDIEETPAPTTPAVPATPPPTIPAPQPAPQPAPAPQPTPMLSPAPAPPPVYDDDDYDDFEDDYDDYDDYVDYDD